MYKLKVAVLALALSLLGGCALSPTVQYKKGTGPITVSTTDEGLSFWTEIPADEIRLANSNVFVGGAPYNFSMMGGVVLADKSTGNARLAKLVPAGFAVELSPIVAESMLVAAKGKSTREIVLSKVHVDSIDMQLTPMSRVLHTGDGMFAVAPQIKVAFVDTEGKRQNRTYVYDSQLQLPMGSANASWATDDLRIYKRHLSLAYEVLAQVIWLDQEGRFQKALNSETPNVISERKMGLITAKTVLIEDLGDYRVTHGMVGSNRGTQHIVVEDKRTAANLLDKMK